MAFADRGFEFFLDLGLRLAQHVLDDAFSGLVIACGVAALPAAILSFSDVPFPICSSFWHGISPFRNEQYRNQGNKATEKRNRYQKVIICPSEPRRLIFVYGGAISALPGNALLWLQRCVFWTAKKSLFIDYSGAKYARFIPKNTVALKALFLVAENSGFAV